MKLSQLFTKTRKNVPKEETSLNAQLLIKGGFIDKEMAGVYTFLPLGLKVLRKIENIVREEINNIGGVEVLMPTLTSIEKYKTTGRENIDVLFKTKLYSGSEFVLNQSHEEVITPLVQQFASSYKDLPRYVYQIQNKFRNEVRAKSGLLRGREFLMKDLYSFHKDSEDLDKYYEKATKAYVKIFKRLGFKEVYLTFASGGTFSKYSHEFQVPCEAGEDEIHVCDKCNIAVNKEITEKPFDTAPSRILGAGQGKQKGVCPQCGNKKLRKIDRTIEVGNIFKLNDKFSKSFNYYFIDDKGQRQPVLMGCYGIGISRNMGAIVESNYDDKGIVWPESVAPYQVHLIELKTSHSAKASRDKQNSKPKTKVEKLYNQLYDAGVEVLYDDREVSAGEKFADADLIGCPTRIIISERTLQENSVEIKKRDQEKGKLVEIKDVINYLMK
ncbi:MAG: Proline-tRNA ligase [uncultured bacterium]|nr:MAG: Proline-tRNA ligase [uncultured bacterium]